MGKRRKSSSIIFLACALLAMLFVTLFSYNHLKEEEAEARAEKRSLEEELQALQENLSLVSDRVGRTRLPPCRRGKPKGRT